MLIDRLFRQVSAGVNRKDGHMDKRLLAKFRNPGTEYRGPVLGMERKAGSR